MTQDEIVKGNKLIAEFMGLPLKRNIVGKQPAFNQQTAILEEQEIIYPYDDYNNLMPVLEKIQNRWVNTELRMWHIYPDEIAVSLSHGDKYRTENGKATTLLLAIKEAIIQFIQWYNTQKQHQSWKQDYDSLLNKARNQH